ncbi:MAG: hypothetical protein HKO59_10205 [Phycisphaerales bacterium]|nr:hypothetical protein [Phycisphaerales bacterium]NNM26336.1 hypothetical protein [Phycisphaerales bacterium]
MTPIPINVTFAATLVATETPRDVPATQWVAAGLMMLGVVLLGLVMTASIRSRIAKRQAATPSPRERLDAIKEAAARQESVHALESQMHETARHLAGQLDAKREWLEQLITQADERIARLDTLLAVEPPPPPAPAPASETNGPAPPPPASPPHDPLASAVYELADLGEDPVTIARRLDEQVGKVELILALRGSAAADR